MYKFDYHIGPVATIKDKSQSPQAPHLKNCFARDVRDKYKMTVRTLKQMDLKEHGDLIESYGFELADLVVKPTLKKEFKATLITQHFIPRMINASVKKFRQYMIPSSSYKPVTEIGDQLNHRFDKLSKKVDTHGHGLSMRLILYFGTSSSSLSLKCRFSG